MSCDRRNFTECDRCILNLARQQLMQTEENTLTFNKEQQILTQLKQVFARLGAIAFGSASSAIARININIRFEL